MLPNGMPRTAPTKWLTPLSMVHGGMGVDRDYPLHRYTLWNKHIETSLGAGTQQLRRLGEIFASS